MLLRSPGGEVETSDATQSRTARLILRYVAEKPSAEDTVEGIVEWWLLEEEIKCRVTEVKQVLAELVARGFIVERTGQDQRTRYQLNRDRLEEVLAWLSNL